MTHCYYDTAALINLLAEVLSTQQALFVKKVKPVRDWLKKYLKVLLPMVTVTIGYHYHWLQVGINYRYERRKTIAENEVIENLRVPIRLTPVLVSILVVS